LHPFHLEEIDVHQDPPRSVQANVTLGENVPRRVR
jgi:hypothetical protein